MSAADAIKAATVTAAELLDISDLAGTIAPGKSADIIAVARRSADRRHRTGAGEVRHGAGRS